MSYTPKNPNGQAAMAASDPVVIASDQSDVPVTGTITAVTSITNALPAGTNNIGDVDVASIAAGDNNIGNVDIVSGVITTVSTVTNLSQLGGANVPIGAGLEATAVRVTLPTDGTGKVGLIAGTANIGDVDVATIAAGDNNIGNVDIVTMPAVTVTGVSTLAEQQTQTTALQLIDDTVYTDDTSTHATGTSKGIGIMAAATPTDGSVGANDIGMVAMTTDRQLNVRATVASGGIASGAIASGAIASGAIASGAVASGAIASGAIAAGAIAAGATSIATTEDTASAAGDHLVKVAQIRLDTPVSGANLSGSGDYTQFIADSFGKTWTAGTYPEDLAHVAGEPINGNGVRRIDTAASSAGSSGDWATMDASAEGAVWSTLTPTTTSGLSVANFTSGDTYTALTNSAQVIKASAGNLYGYYIYNPNTSATYVLLYNIAAASVTVGTSTALLVFCIPASSGANMTFPYPVTFSNAGWSIAAATTGGGNSAPATALEAMIFYK